MLGVSTSIASISLCSGCMHKVSSFGERDNFRGVCIFSGLLFTTEDFFGLEAITFVSPNSIDLCNTLTGGEYVLLDTLAVFVFSTSTTFGESLTLFMPLISSAEETTLLLVSRCPFEFVVAFGAGLRALEAIGVTDSSSLDGTSNTLAFTAKALEGEGLFLGLFSRLGSEGATLGDLDRIGAGFFSGEFDCRKRAKLCSGIRLRTVFPYVAIFFLGRDTMISSWPAIVMLACRWVNRKEELEVGATRYSVLLRKRVKKRRTCHLRIIAYWRILFRDLETLVA